MPSTPRTARRRRSSARRMRSWESWGRCIRSISMVRPTHRASPPASSAVRSPAAPPRAPRRSGHDRHRPRAPPAPSRGWGSGSNPPAPTVDQLPPRVTVAGHLARPARRKLRRGCAAAGAELLRGTLSCPAPGRRPPPRSAARRRRFRIDGGHVTSLTLKLRASGCATASPTVDSRPVHRQGSRPRRPPRPNISTADTFLLPGSRSSQPSRTARPPANRSTSLVSTVKVPKSCQASFEPARRYRRAGVRCVSLSDVGAASGPE